MNKFNHSAPVRFVATIKLMPLALASIPKAIKEQVQSFNDQVTDEMESRKELVLRTIAE